MEKQNDGLCSLAAAWVPSCDRNCSSASPLFSNHFEKRFGVGANKKQVSDGEADEEYCEDDGIQRESGEVSRSEGGETEGGTRKVRPRRETPLPKVSPLRI